MFLKLVRGDYYNEEYPLNEQEYKEFNFPRVDPYWRVRALLYTFSLNPLGDKKTLLRRVESLLFEKYLYKRSGDEELREISDIEIETLINSSKIEFSPKEQKHYSEWEAAIREGTQFFSLPSTEPNSRKVEFLVHREKVRFRHSTKSVLPMDWPWEVVKELGRQNKRFTYSEVHRGLTNLMRSTMCFFNHTLEGESLSAIVAFPYTEDIIKTLSDSHIFALADQCNLISEEEKDKFIAIPVLRQRLLDTIYAVQDAPRMHAIFPCQSRLKKCFNLASGFCSNTMCKLCCQENSHRTACIIHDSADQFLREKVRALNQFEAQFDKRLTIRIQIGKLVRCYELEKVFENYKINWNLIKVFYSIEINRIEFIYVVCESIEAAKRIMSPNDRAWFTQKLKRHLVKITALSNDIMTAHENFTEPYEKVENVAVIIKPPGNLEVIEELQDGPNLLMQVQQLIKMITLLDDNQFIIRPDTNPITREPDYSQMYVFLPDKSYVKKLYDSQPFFGCLLVHKLTHPCLCPFVKYSKDVCIISDSEKSPGCIRDMNHDACARQVKVNIPCPASAQLIQKLAAKRKEAVAKYGESKICIKCENFRVAGCNTGLCSTCYAVQARREESPIQNESYYWKELKNMTPFMLARKMLGTVGDMHLKVREELMCGRYDWFKPIYGTNIESSMIKANKDLQEVIDNGHLIRGHASKKFVKEGKIFTFQGNEPLTYWTDENECIHEDIDNKGRPYVEYIYNSTEENPKIEQWVKCSEDKFRTFTREDCHLYLNAPNLNIRNDFHLFFFGLDKVNLTIKELYQEILIKMQTLVGHVDIKSIMIIDNESLLAHMMANDMLKKSTVLNENLSKLGRIACVKFENVLDAMAIITKRVTVNLPLNNGRNDEPYIVPSKWLLNYIMSINPEAPPLSFQNAGRAFSLHNKQIENCSAELRNHIFGNVADKNRRKKKNTRKAGAKRAAAKRGQI